ncbi:hypothetical protein I6A84_28075 [Frankia sp. CNm7]|uniref:Acetyl-CoA carboxylase biotin carboxyl carrier protein subunit n=1 Tax=Frankia nepalensis TaxID=1836974 RepID=A0A937RUN5_9ACTN|nr:acyl-CoA carboxylase epsilon subunit [Frankia nepalensis]MBL7502367.1 hypothetical protein [Frankia nepalensis]MBL7514240.1 hypothetical protein [Frankia nepalensis]MBL7521834.1 hypothetical protein [Frankia nepalensis]MBL7633639.1 hypothetical protein [Frankia nepalensis]
MAESEGAESRRPLLRLVRGDATPEEIAAVVAVLAAHAAATAAVPPRPPRSVWADRSQVLRVSAGAGPGGWRRAGILGGVRTG